jgi:hypothetical protein
MLRRGHSLLSPLLKPTITKAGTTAWHEGVRGEEER